MADVALLITIVVAFTQLVKSFIPNKYLPALTLILGVIAGVFYVDGSLKEQIMYGLMIGLSAAGLFDQSKIITKKGDK